MDETLKALLSKHYGDFPEPTDQAQAVAHIVSKLLATNGINEPGVIGVCGSHAGWWYVGFSPSLQASIKSKKGASTYMPWLCSAIKKEADYKKVFICASVSKEILKEKNPGCAEKKIISALSSWGDKAGSFYISQHPLNVSLSLLANYEAVGNEDGLHIAPCDSCKRVAATRLS